jgi:Ca-activated chloride channel homolog
MNQKKIFIALFLIGSITADAQEQEAERLIQAGNEFFRQLKYEEALGQYDEALKIAPGNNTAKYNQSIAYYRAGKQAEAIKKMEELAAYEGDVELKSKAYYNKGAILSRQSKLEESIEAYKNALRQNPGDSEARENLQKALQELKKKNPPKKKEDKNKKNEQKQNQNKQPQPKMSRREAEQRLKLLEQKEKQAQQRIQQQKSKTGAPLPKDW